MSQPTVEEKLSQIFPPESRAEARRILDEYSDAEGERVQLAALKLCEGKIEDLREAVKAAGQDYRDVLAWAEYPNQMKASAWGLSPEKARQLREEDRQQYLEWLNAEN